MQYINAKVDRYIFNNILLYRERIVSIWIKIQINVCTTGKKSNILLTPHCMILLIFAENYLKTIIWLERRKYFFLNFSGNFFSNIVLHLFDEEGQMISLSCGYIGKLFKFLNDNWIFFSNCNQNNAGKKPIHNLLY